MSDPGTIVGVISLAIQISQVAVQCASRWKSFPDDVKEFLTELQSLRVILSVTQSSLLANAPPETETKRMLNLCQRKLDGLLKELTKNDKGHRMGWGRIKAAILSADTRKSVEDLRRQCQILNDALSIDSITLQVSAYKEVRSAREEQREWHQAEEANELLSWLSADTHNSLHHEFREKRQKGTGQWLLGSEEFQNWCKGDKKTLFCRGMPGAGKTYMTSIVVDHLHANVRSGREQVGVAYLYCNYPQKDSQTPTNLFCSLLKQFLLGLPDLPESTRRLHKGNRKELARPSSDVVLKELRGILRGYSKSFILVDALDECWTADIFEEQFIGGLFRLQSETGVNIFATSRSIPSIMKNFEGRSVSLEIHADPEDVQRYLNGRMSQFPAFVKRDTNLQNYIKGKIANAVNGMFLLAKFHMDDLITQPSRKALLKALKELPRGSDAYDISHKNAMERIKQQNRNSRELAKQVLSWITYAKEPLTTFELQHAIAVEVGETVFDEDNCTEIEHMISVCGGLVTVNSESNIVRFVHHTVQEFFERNGKDIFPNAETDITKTCVSYLSFDFGEGFHPKNSKLTWTLYRYAAQNWGHHARSSSPDAVQLISDFLKNKAKVSASLEEFDIFPQLLEYDIPLPVRSGIIGIHLAAYFGLEGVMRSLLHSGEDPNAKDSVAWTPLMYAIEFRRNAMLTDLLELGDLILDSRSSKGRMELLLAALADYKSIVKMLVKHGADANYVDNFGYTLLRQRLYDHREEVIMFLLNRDTVTVDLLSGQMQIVELLRLLFNQKMMRDSSKDMSGHECCAVYACAVHGDTAKSLFIAARSGNESMVQLLLRCKANVDSEDKSGETPLVSAVTTGIYKSSNSASARSGRSSQGHNYMVGHYNCTLLKTGMRQWLNF